MPLKEKTRKRFEQAGLRSASWYVNHMYRMRPPGWDANHGRFIYTRHMPSGRTIWGLNWTQARGIFVLLAGWEVTGDVEMLRTAMIAGEYIKLLQIYDAPDNPRRQFAIREQVPQSWMVAPRDACEAALGLLHLHRATGREDDLRRVVDFERWLAANAWGRGYPCSWVRLDSNQRNTSTGPYQAGDMRLFHDLWKATGQARYRDTLVDMADTTLRRYVGRDGAIRSRAGRQGHHEDASGVVLNDDGLMVGLIAAGRATGEARYLDAARQHGQWLLDNVRPPLPMLCALPCMCATMLDLAAATGEDQWTDWAAEMMVEHVLPLQVRGKRDPMADGAFRGEDEPVEYYGPKSAKKTDFVTTRTTCYAALACFRLAGLDALGYSAFGWGRKVKRPRKLPALHEE
jgi:hypothetical protein